MAITFHCSHCGKKIEAQDSAGGKWGKCPACHNKIYVPDLNADADLPLAPLNEAEERKKRQLMAETHQLHRSILQERETPDENLGPSTVAVPKISDKKLTKNIILYLRQVADGELKEAEETEKSVVPYGGRAVGILDRIAVSEIPESELANIPPQVLSGLIRTLRAKIS